MINIICIGKIKEKYLKEAIEDYKKRINKYHKINIIELPDSNVDEEGKEIKKYLSKKDYTIALAIEGKEITSTELAEKIDKIFINFSTINFINLSDYKLSFSKLTFPHGLFRVILLEQIYRSFKILNNETYHK